MTRSDLAVLVCATAAFVIAAALLVLGFVWRRNVTRLRGERDAARHQCRGLRAALDSANQHNWHFGAWTDELKGNDS